MLLKSCASDRDLGHLLLPGRGGLSSIFIAGVLTGVQLPLCIAARGTKLLLQLIGSHWMEHDEELRAT